MPLSFVNPNRAGPVATVFLLAQVYDTLKEHDALLEKFRTDTRDNYESLVAGNLEKLSLDWFNHVADRINFIRVRTAQLGNETTLPRPMPLSGEECGEEKEPALLSNFSHSYFCSLCTTAVCETTECWSSDGGGRVRVQSKGDQQDLVDELADVAEAVGSCVEVALTTGADKQALSAAGQNFKDLLDVNPPPPHRYCACMHTHRQAHSFITYRFIYGFTEGRPHRMS